jgi:hypothetical protein
MKNVAESLRSSFFYIVTIALIELNNMIILCQIFDRNKNAVCKTIIVV